MNKPKTAPPGRPASDGAENIIRVTIGLTKWHHQQLKKLAGADGASAWIRNAINKASNEKS